jgi:hypothetical protein
MNGLISAFLIICASLTIFSQFGRRLSAKHSLVWLLVFIFLLVAALVPHWLEPIAHAAGFKLVSNFVLAGLIFFAFLEILQQSTQNVQVNRRLRDIICAHAAERFIEKFAEHTTSQQKASRPDVLVISPCFNEEEVLPSTIQSLASLTIEHPEINYCIINDGSRDSSLSILKENAKNNHTSHMSNAGVGAALLTGFLAARDLGAEFVVQCDSDGQHPIADIPRIVAYAKRNKTDLLIGSRFVSRIQEISDDADTHKTNFSGPSLESTSLSRWLGGRMISLALSLFGRNARIKDPTSGFRVYSRAAYTYLIDHMPEEYPEPESIALLLQAGMKVEETLVSMQPRAGGVSSISGFKSAQFMIKVFTALVAMRLRSSFNRSSY